MKGRKKQPLKQYRHKEQDGSCSACNYISSLQVPQQTASPSSQADPYTKISLFFASNKVVVGAAAACLPRIVDREEKRRKAIYISTII